MLRKLFDHTFIGDLFPRGGVVVDLGGNRGEFAREMRSLYDARVYVVEPVPELFNAIPKEKEVVGILAAVSGKNGEIEIFLPEGMCATMNSAAGGRSIIAKEYKYADLIADHKIEKIDLLKMDIECAEISLIESLLPEDFNKITQCAVEFHDFLYPELGPRVEELKKKFEDNGFYCIPFSLTTNGDVLFVKRGAIPFWKYAYLKYFARFWRGGIRKIKKILK
ncbi:MAG: methyltransferase FkbM family [Parcubacteria group bacterium LiPW_15]|nr:MAG: methyltransferase FkbM family [Parcubacteria group bacterium LiPW_15]